MESAHFTMDVTMDMEVSGSTVTMILTAEGDVEMVGTSPEDANMKMEMTVALLGQTAETETIAVNGELWTREAGKSWEKVPAASVNPTSGLGGDPAAALRILEQAKSLEKLGDEVVDGVDCYHFSFVLDADALFTPEVLEGLTGGSQLTDEQARKLIESAVLEGESWLGKEDLFLRRQVSDMAFEISGIPELGGAVAKYDMWIDMRFSKINEPVEIKAPLD
jgi:hypothetical protein